MHRIIKSNLKTFCDEKSISENEKESKKFECFANYCVVYEVYGDDFDVWNITSAEDDQGIDGIAYLIDNELVTTYDEAVSIFDRHKRNIDVDIYFIQSKTAESYDRGDILKFGDGVEDFTRETPELPQGEFIKSQKRIFELLFEKIDKISNGSPNIYLRYVCTSDNGIAKEIEATKRSIVTKLKSSHIFNSVEFEFLGVEELTKLWKKSRITLSANIPTMSILSFPQMEGIKQAYLTIVSAKQYVENILMDENQKMKGGIFEENVRAFLGSDNPVNEAIERTIGDSESQNRFAVLNNGITIISHEVKNMGTTISLSDYQIVNGCQTSNLLYSNYDKLDDSTYLTVRIVQAEETDIISEIVKATNSQTKVDDTQFLSFATLFRKIELYFDSMEDSGEEIKLYLERRLNQYKNTDIQRNRIFKLQDICRAVESMYFDKPDEAGRNPSKMIADDIGNLTNDKNKEIAYYAAALALYRINFLVRKGRILNKYTIYRWHILMIIKYIVSGRNIPQITNEKYCKKIIHILVENGDECVNLFSKAIDVINEVGMEDRDVVRTGTYTQRILSNCKSKFIDNLLHEE